MSNSHSLSQILEWGGLTAALQGSRK